MNDLQILIMKLKEHQEKKMELLLSIKKTKLMITGTIISLGMDSEGIELVETFSLLRLTKNPTGTRSEEICQR